MNEKNSKYLVRKRSANYSNSQNWDVLSWRSRILLAEWTSPNSKIVYQPSFQIWSTAKMLFRKPKYLIEEKKRGAFPPVRGFNCSTFLKLWEQFHLFDIFIIPILREEQQLEIQKGVSLCIVLAFPSPTLLIQNTNRTVEIEQCGPSPRL